MLFFQIVTICPPSLPSRTSRYPRLSIEIKRKQLRNFRVFEAKNLVLDQKIPKLNSVIEIQLELSNLGEVGPNKFRTDVNTYMHVSRD